MNFNTSKKTIYKAMLPLLIAVAFLYLNVNPTSVNFFPKCPLYATTGIYCPGCGSQRATHYLLNFNFWGVLEQNILYVFGLLILTYHLTIEGLNLFFKKNIYNYMNHSKTPMFVLIFIILFFIARNITYEPFNWLAPN